MISRPARGPRRRAGALSPRRGCAATGCRATLPSRRMHFCGAHYAALSRELRHELALMVDRGRFAGLADLLARARAHIAAAAARPSPQQTYAQTARLLGERED